MTKRFKHLTKNGKVYLLHFVTDGVLFGSGWRCLASFDETRGNIKRCESITRLLNECDSHTNHPDDD